MDRTSIIKSPIAGANRVRIGDPVLVQVDAAKPQLNEYAEMEAKLHTRYKKEFEEKLAQERDKAREEGHAQGYRDGMVEGHAEGVAAGRDAFRHQLERLETLFDQGETALAEFWETTSGAVESLTLQAVGMLLGEHALSPVVIVGLVRQMMARLHESDVLKVRLHPVEHARLQEAIHGEEHAVRLRLGRLSDRLVADPALDAGGCIIETIRGEYCGTLEIQLTRLYQALQARRQPLATTESGRLSSDGVACA